MIEIHDVKQGSPEWMALRKDKWTGSKALDLLLGKPMKADSGTYRTWAMQRGTVLEPIAIAEYERETGTSVLRPGFVTNTKYQNAGYSPDGICGDTLLEVKCLNGKNHDSIITGDIPLKYLAQIYFGLVVCELKKAQLIAFNPEYTKQINILEITVDDDVIKNIKAKLKSASPS